MSLAEGPGRRCQITAVTNEPNEAFRPVLPPPRHICSGGQPDAASSRSQLARCPRGRAAAPAPTRYSQIHHRSSEHGDSHIVVGLGEGFPPAHVQQTSGLASSLPALSPSSHCEPQPAESISEAPGTVLPLQRLPPRRELVASSSFKSTDGCYTHYIGKKEKKKSAATIRAEVQANCNHQEVPAGARALCR